MREEGVTISPADTEQDRADALTVRFAVFVDEQGVPPELEADTYDAEARHFLVRDQNGAALGTLRILDKGDGIAKIGRVAVLREARGRGVGKRLMQHALALLRRDDFKEVILDAQMSVLAFYETLGFQAEGPEFEDAGIRHRRMRCRLR